MGPPWASLIYFTVIVFMVKLVTLGYKGKTDRTMGKKANSEAKKE